MHFIKKLTLILGVTFFNLFSMENGEIIKSNSTLPLSTNFIDLKMKFTKEENRAIFNEKTGNTLVMELFENYEQALLRETPENQLAGLDIIESYLKNNHQFLDLQTKNLQGKTLKDILIRVGVTDPKTDFEVPLSADFVKERIVFESNEFKKFWNKKQEERDSKLEALVKNSKVDKNKLKSFFSTFQKKENKVSKVSSSALLPRRSFSSSHIIDMSSIISPPEIEEINVIIDPRLISWLVGTKNHVLLIRKKMSKIFQEYFLDEKLKEIEKDLIEQANISDKYFLNVKFEDLDKEIAKLEAQDKIRYQEEKRKAKEEKRKTKKKPKPNVQGIFNKDKEKNQ